MDSDLIMTSIYSDRIYGEQPVGLWSLDIDYLTMISPQDNNVLTWGGDPKESYVSYIQDRVPSYPGPGEVTRVYNNSNSLEVHNNDIISQASDSVDIGFWLYTQYSITGLEVSVIDSAGTAFAPTFIADGLAANKWHPITTTFPVASAVLPYGIKIEVSFADTSDHSFLIGQVLVGQEVGAALLTNGGSIPIVPPVESGLSYSGITQVVPVEEYGFGLDTGYAVVDEKLMAINRGIPMIYGDTTSTHLQPSESPAIVFPGKGVFHQSGKFRELTLETWIRVRNGQHPAEARVFGPLASNDGLWVKENTVCLVVGTQIVSFDVGDIFQPLLISIVFFGTDILLRVNGRDIGSVGYGTFPNSHNYNTDWIAFYCPVGFDSVEIGTVAIFPYAVSSMLSKRHFVWGQSVRINVSDAVSYNRPSARFYNSSKVVLSEPYKSVTTDQSEAVFGMDHQFKITSYQRKTILPLSALAQTRQDDGNRTLSKLDFIQFSASGSGHEYYVSIQKTSDKSSKILEDYPAPEPFAEGLITVTPGKAFTVRNKSLLEFDVKYPHLYSLNIFVVTTQTSLIAANDPVIAVSSVINDSFGDLGSNGDLRSIPFSKEDTYYVKNNPAKYCVGNDDGTALGLGNSGLDIIDGNVMVIGRRPQTFMGIQMWVKFTGHEGNLSLILDGNEVELSILSSGQSANLIIGQNDGDLSLTFYQDGHSVAVPRLFKGVWTSIGIALDSPIELETYPKLIIGQGLTYKSIILYGGENLSKLVAFRTWGQITDSQWDDFDEITWQEVLTLEAEAPTIDIGSLYRGIIGANRYVVGENPQNLFIVDNGMSVVMREIYTDADDSVSVSVPSWKTLGTYS